MNYIKPDKKDFDEYYHYYVDLVNPDNLINAFGEIHIETQRLLSSVPEKMGNYKYQSKKWTIKEILCHLIDTERIFNYRALRFSRNDTTELPGYDHDKYVENSSVMNRSLKALSFEFQTLRNSTIELYKGFDHLMLNKSGIANGKRLTVLAIGFINVGHEIHHINVIKEKYLALCNY